MKKHLKNNIFRILFTIVSLILIFVFHNQIINSYTDFARWLFPVNSNRNGELFKIVLSVLGALGILYGLYISLRRAKAIEQGVEKQGEAIEIQSKQIELSRKSQTDERFKNAVEHLGSEKEPIIFGGIAELHQIARENKNEYSEIVFNILCSYIRTNSNINTNKKTSILQTIVDFLFSKSIDNPYLGFKANLKNSNLIGINFINANLESANLSNSRLSSFYNSNLSNTILEGTIFFLSNIENVNFTDSKLNRTIFYDTKINDCDFNVYKDYSTASFIEGNIEKVKFENIEVIDWNFIGVKITDTSFIKCKIISTIFSASCLHNVDFIDIELFMSNDFRATQFVSVKMHDFIISKSNFKGCRTERGFRSPFFKDLPISIGIEPDMCGINFINTTLTKCIEGILTQKDIDEIEEKFESLQSKVLK
ncbi:pentapeptide repeat-containing protein [Aquimarina sp. 2-A2]|uniref:pentapeptide repeat-containing protein n=1 Tax=Aquimarina sp. 2-A2 TaxID=3382644 RepID=UPI00387EF139